MHAMIIFFISSIFIDTVATWKNSSFVQNYTLFVYIFQQYHVKIFLSRIYFCFSITCCCKMVFLYIWSWMSVSYAGQMIFLLITSGIQYLVIIQFHVQNWNNTIDLQFLTVFNSSVMFVMSGLLSTVKLFFNNFKGDLTRTWKISW